MATITKDKLATLLYTKKGYKKYSIKNAIDDIFEEIATVLEDGDKVLISGFGTFEVKLRKSHPAVHPETKKPIIVPSYKNVKFKSGDLLVERIRKPDGKVK